ncbi:MAG TPA: hypothetical protein VM869_07835, partial [Enhygromyxa sp.]|nr:hypothetical protein [Enhygromyxa sp.]
FDRAGEWADARMAWARLVAIEVPQGERTMRGDQLIDESIEIDPDRLLRADTSVPTFCSPALVDGERVDRLCLEDFFPHETPTLIIGTASWCGACNEQLPHVLEALREQPIRVLAFNYDEDPELAAGYLSTHGIDGWTMWMPRLDPSDPVVPGDLNLRTIPFLALVDSRGRVELGPPWLDAPLLAEHLNRARE